MSDDAATLGEPIRVVVAGDVRLYREGLRRSLSASDALVVVETAASAPEALQAVRDSAPDVLLIDMSTDGSLEAVRGLVLESPDTRIVAFAVAGDESDVVTYAEAGVDGYVPRSASIEHLVSTIRHVHKGEVLCSPRVAGDAFRRLATLAAAGPPILDALHLTARETEIVELLEEGLSNKQIAKALFIEVATVKNHVHRVLRKLDVSRRTEVRARIRGFRAAQRSRSVRPKRSGHESA